MPTPTSEQLHEAWAANLAIDAASPIGIWATDTRAGLRLAILLLTDAEHRIAELIRELAELIHERDQAWLDRTATSDMLCAARERIEELERDTAEQK